MLSCKLDLSKTAFSKFKLLNSFLDRSEPTAYTTIESFSKIISGFSYISDLLKYLYEISEKIFFAIISFPLSNV